MTRIQGMPAAARSWKTKKDPLLELPERTQPCRHLDLGPLASRTVRKYPNISFIKVVFTTSTLFSYVIALCCLNHKYMFPNCFINEGVEQYPLFVLYSFSILTALTGGQALPPKYFDFIKLW